MVNKTKRLAWTGFSKQTRLFCKANLLITNIIGPAYLRTSSLFGSSIEDIALLARQSEMANEEVKVN